MDDLVFIPHCNSFLLCLLLSQLPSASKVGCVYLFDLITIVSLFLSSVVGRLFPPHTGMTVVRSDAAMCPAFSVAASSLVQQQPMFLFTEKG